MSGLACGVKMHDLTDMLSSCFSYKERSCLLCQVGLSTSVLEGGCMMRMLERLPDPACLDIAASYLK
jgi:hypothetical protein